MSIYRVNPNDVETFTVVTNPVRTYTSSSIHGATGSVYVFARRSDIEKETAPLSAFIEVTHNDADIDATLASVRAVRQVDDNGDGLPDNEAAFASAVEGYMSTVHTQAPSARKRKVLDVIRFTPSVSFTSNTLRKLIVKDVLQNHYRTSYPTAHWAYTNYNSLNFFTASTVPTSSVLLYPNIGGGPLHEGYVSGTYTLSGAFSFDFYVNPRYQTDNPDGHFKAATLFHLSSSYAVSLVTGSARDENGRPVGFRVQLQLSHSADVLPSRATQGTYPNDLIFLSDDNSLEWNRWHHVVIRWGTNLINDGTGSFNIDKVDRGYFVVPSGTISPRLFSGATRANPDVLCIGNYYEGQNNGVTAQAYFFANDPTLRDGLNQLIDDGGGTNEPTVYAFNHPFKGEVHDLAIKRYYMSDTDIDTSSSVGPTSIDTDWVAFYLPPFFVESSSYRRFVGDVGGILQTPFFEVDGTTNDPFNVAMSFGVNGHYINIENFLRDFASNVFPRVHHMSGVALTSTADTARSANDFLYDQPFVVRRNLLVMPCDDGLFVPSFELLVSESLQSSYTDDLGLEELSFINLDNLISSRSLLFGGAFDTVRTDVDIATGTDSNGDGIADFVNEQIGFTPENPSEEPGPAFFTHINMLARAIQSGTFDPGLQEGAPLTIYQRTRDPSSNQVTFFDISNLFYGKRILPGSFELRDTALSGSAGAVSITLKDDGRGNLYRADCVTSASSWNSIGNIYYDEGIVVIKSPHLYFFGKEGYEMSFRGEQNVHVMKLNVLAPANQLNSSSNPCFQNVPPSSVPNDPEREFVYVTGLNFHDNNMNVVLKTQLAQPFVKKHGDRALFKVKIDY